MELQDHFLIALDPQGLTPFQKSVVYVCEYGTKGTMGLVINRPCGLHLHDVFDALEIHITPRTSEDSEILTGGPVEENVGFVLHTNGQNWESSLHTSPTLSVTTSKDIINAIAHKEGPEQSLITLGYCGWEPGQLEEELKNNFWLTCPADPEIIFNTPVKERWQAAIRLLGFEPYQLMSKAVYV